MGLIHKTSLIFFKFKLFSKSINLYNQVIESMIRNISGRLGIILRRNYYSTRFAECGKDVVIDVGVVIEGVKEIFIGDNVWIDKYSILMAGRLNISNKLIKIKLNKRYIYKEGELHIGSNVHISPQCIIQAHAGVSIADYFTASAGTKIYSLSNDVSSCKFGTHSKEKINYILSPISIDNNVWLGLNSIVLGGNIGENSFISPNSVVTSNIPKNSFATGNPIKNIKDRFQNDGVVM